jgi:formamidopyrimidine-DNA glycosylase
VKSREQVAAEKDKFVRMVFGLNDNGTGGTGRGTRNASQEPGTASQDLLLFRDIRKFGRVWCGRREEIIGLKSFNKLGPEPLVITAVAFAKRLRAKRGRLKSLLLNQEFLAGLGNIYADEALFEAQLHPLAHAHRVAPASAARLHAAIQRILGKAISAGGSSIDDYLHPDGTPGWFQRQLKAYGREGEPCTRCKTPIKRQVVGQRGTWFCPKCQKKR